MGKLLVTTTPYVEGYRIVETIGLVSAESVYGFGLLSSIWNGLKDFIKGITIGIFISYEQSGDTSLYIHAKHKAMDKIKKAAEEHGANAIICFTTSSSSSNLLLGRYAHVSMFGTAVIIEKIPNGRSQC